LVTSVRDILPLQAASVSSLKTDMADRTGISGWIRNLAVTE